MFHGFVDNVVRWALVDDKPKILLDILHAIDRSVRFFFSNILIVNTVYVIDLFDLSTIPF
jgi:hypothetical protein